MPALTRPQNTERLAQTQILKLNSKSRHQLSVLSRGYPRLPILLFVANLFVFLRSSDHFRYCLQDPSDHRLPTTDPRALALTGRLPVLRFLTAKSRLVPFIGDLHPPTPYKLQVNMDPLRRYRVREFLRRLGITIVEDSQDNQAEASSRQRNGGLNPTARDFSPINSQRAAEGNRQRTGSDAGKPHQLSAVRGTYRGDLSIKRNHSADIPEDLNCCLWIKNLPTAVTEKSLPLFGIPARSTSYISIL